MFDDYGYGFPEWYPGFKSGPVDTPKTCPPVKPDPPTFDPVVGPVPNPPGSQEKVEPIYIDQNKNRPILLPLPPQLPPKHTQVQPRCFTCKHFEMCGFKKDYLKTVTLIQNKLGAPAQDYEATTNYILIPNFVGFVFYNEDKYFPKHIEFDNSDFGGDLFLAKFNGINYVNVVYLERNHYILIQLIYSKDSELYELKSCEDAFYGVKYELNQKSLEEIQLGLVEWREMIINAKMPPPPPKPEVINTTHFSAMLNCDMYEWNKETFEQAINRLKREYPWGIPMDPDRHGVYHIATFHIEGKEVPYSPCFDEVALAKGPKFIAPPAKKSHKPPKRFGDM